MPLTSSQLPDMYVDLGIDTGDMGCIMLDTLPIVISDIIAGEDFFISEKEDGQYKNGNVSEDVPHVTLLYGLMSSGPALKKHVDTVLKGWQFPDLHIDKVSYFESHDPDEDSVTIIALLKVTDDLAEGNNRLRLLPHIDTFPDYKPHITLAYVKADSDWRSYVAQLNDKYAGTQAQPIVLNYGK